MTAGVSTEFFLLEKIVDKKMKTCYLSLIKRTKSTKAQKEKE